MGSLAYLRISNIGRGNNKSAVASAAYRAAIKIKDQLEGLTKNYTKKKKEVMFSKVYLPKSAPEQHFNIEILWNDVQMAESPTSQNCRYAKQLEIAFPYGLSLEEEIAICEALAEEFTKNGYAVQSNIHHPNKKGKKPNPHAHMMIPTRPYNSDGTFCMKTKQKKDYVYILDEQGNKIQETNTDGSLKYNQRNQPVYKREPLLDEQGNQKFKIRPGKGKEPLWRTKTIEANYLDDIESLSKWKKIWEDTCNRYLSLKGIPTISFDTHSRTKLIDLPDNLQIIPQRHLSPSEYNMMQKGIETQNSKTYRQIEEYNNNVLQKLRVNKQEWYSDVLICSIELTQATERLADLVKNNFMKVPRIKKSTGFYQQDVYNKIICLTNDKNKLIKQKKKLLQQEQRKSYMSKFKRIFSNSNDTDDKILQIDKNIRELEARISKIDIITDAEILYKQDVDILERKLNWYRYDMIELAKVMLEEYECIKYNNEASSILETTEKALEDVHHAKDNLTEMRQQYACTIKKLKLYEINADDEKIDIVYKKLAITQLENTGKVDDDFIIKQYFGAIPDISIDKIYTVIVKNSPNKVKLPDLKKHIASIKEKIDRTKTRTVKNKVIKKISHNKSNQSTIDI